MSRKTTPEFKSQAKNAADVSKERLKRILKTRPHHLRTANRVLKYGAKSFVRNTWLSIAAIAIMAVTLVVLSVTLIATNIMGTAIHEVESQVDMSIYVKQGATQAQIDRIIGRMSQLSTVTSINFTSPENANRQSIEKLIEENNITDEANIASLYNAPNKLPWTLNVKLVSLNNTSELENFVNTDESMVNMLDAKPPSYSSSHRETIDRIASVMNRVELIGLAAAGIFALIAILVVFNTIRMAIFNRKEEIYMMKLVGASRWFIIGPFVVEASFYGVVAALLTGAIVYSTMFGIGQNFGAVADPTLALMRQYYLVIFATLLAAGILIGVISSLLATRKYLKRD